VNHIDQGTMRGVVELALHAPSMHNSQPWRWMLGERSIHLYADMSRWLPVTDADRRDLVVS
jgi:nitroreductase